MAWAQLYVGSRNFNELFSLAKKMYASDAVFQKYIKDDCEHYGREMEGNQVNFFLEEIHGCHEHRSCSMLRSAEPLEISVSGELAKQEVNESVWLS